MTIRVRPAWMYRVAFVVPAVIWTWLLASGRMQALLRVAPWAGPGGAPTKEAFDAAFVAAGLWNGSLLPLMWPVGELAMQHRAGRLYGGGVWVALRDAWRVALQGSLPAEASAGYEAPAVVRPRLELALVLMPIVFFPLFFSFAMPMLRTVSGLLWLIIAGMLSGLVTFLQRRAALLRVDTNAPWSLWNGWSQWRSKHYTPEGRVYIRRARLASVAMGIWWLSGIFWAF